MKVKDIRMSQTYTLANMFDETLNGLPATIKSSFLRSSMAAQKRPIRIYKALCGGKLFEVTASELAPYDPTARFTPAEHEVYTKAVADVEIMLQYLSSVIPKKVMPVKVNPLASRWSLAAVAGGSHVAIELCLERDPINGTLNVSIDVCGSIGIDDNGAYDIDLDLYDTSPAALVIEIRREALKLQNEVANVTHVLRSMQTVAIP